RLPTYLFLHFPAPPPDLHSFPTRRSSDLGLPQRARASPQLGRRPDRTRKFPTDRREARRHRDRGCGRAMRSLLVIATRFFLPARSEEHTSELQSRFDLVCRLLLEKKKKKS